MPGSTLHQLAPATTTSRPPTHLFSHAIFMQHFPRRTTGRRSPVNPIQPDTTPLPSATHSPRHLPLHPLLDLLTPTTASPLASLPSSWLLLLIYSACLCLGTRIVFAFDCDFIRVSNEDGVKNGSFTAPLINGHPIPPQGIQCIYTFIALPHERVKLTFREFHLTGRPPECFHEYVDLYTELRNASEDLVQTDKFGGRFCGRIPPRTRVSLHNTIVLVFASDRNVSAHAFTGMYEFINASMYSMGTRTPSQGTCDFVINSWVNRLGDLFTPTYPGVYPQRIMCTYQLLGQRGQRVRIEFMDFDVFFGGTHCPYDRLTIYDGSTEQDPIIDAYCGSRRNVVVFSSQENLFISFITNRSGGENRGFHALFEFSETYVSLDFITGEHLRGTECDQRVLSHGRSSGVVRSPNSPFPFLPNVVCRYLIEGLNNADDLERVVLRFDMFHMPQVLGASRGDCSEGGLTLYLEGKEDKGAEQRTLCGTHAPTEAIISRDSKMLLKFYSGKTQGLGFTIRYQFETFFAVPGTPHPITTTCEFTYRSSTTKSGEFHSPRHPSNYPSNKNCTYIFQGEDNEQAHVEFDHFRLDGIGTYGPTCDSQDYLDLYEILEPGGDNRGYREVGRYCGQHGPAPLKTRYGVHGIAMHFITNAALVTIGFRGRYYFDPQRPTFHPERICGNVTNGTHGAIESPNFDGNAAKYPPNIDCEWYIHVRPGYNVLINFTFFELEGEQRTSAPTGCLGAGLKIYTDLHKYPAEVCGKLNGTSYHSHGPTMKLLFTSAKRASGNKGFRLTWNEFHYPHSGLGSGCEGDEFYCPVHSYCISHQRVCDGEYHCGEKDLSDEDPELCGTGSGQLLGLSHGMFGGIVGGGVGVLLIVVVVVVCVVRRRSAERRRKRHMQPPPNDWST